MENKIIKKKYDVWQDADNCFMLAIENINLDISKITSTEYLYWEYLSKVLAFEEEIDLIGYLIHEVEIATNTKYTYDEDSSNTISYLIDNKTCEEHWFLDREGLIKYLVEMLRNIEKDGK